MSTPTSTSSPAIADKIAQIDAQATMTAAVVKAYGGPEQLRLDTVPRPVPSAHEIVIQVRAAGVNPIDWKRREGYLQSAPGQSLPLVPGMDVAGVIVAVGSDAMPRRVGDEVLGLTPMNGGGFAEYIALPGSSVATKPENLTWITAGALPVAGLTAWQVLFDAGHLEGGQTVLIHAAAGGVGSMAVQFAKLRGAKVIATASAGNHEYLRSLGADVLVDYKTQRFEDFAQGVDLVFDTLGHETLDRSYAVVKPGGRLVTIVQEPDAEKAKAAGITAQVHWGQNNPAQLEEIAGLVARGQVRVNIERVFPLAEAAAALAESQSGHTRGKIVLLVSA